jgi:hypothetical protein
MNRYANAPTVYTGPWRDHEPDTFRFQEWEPNILREFGAINPFTTYVPYEWWGAPEGLDNSDFMVSNSFVSSTFAVQRAAQLGYVDPEKMAGE